MAEFEVPLGDQQADQMAQQLGLSRAELDSAYQDYLKRVPADQFAGETPTRASPTDVGIQQLGRNLQYGFYSTLLQQKNLGIGPFGGGTDGAAGTGASAATPGRSYWNQAPQISSGTGTAGSGSGSGSGSGGGTVMADGQQPESVALQQMGQIDPATEALRQQLSQSYFGSLSQAGAPTAAQFQNLLGIYSQVDPTTAAARAQLGSDLAAQEALGTQLDPATQREVEQASRRAQVARGNVYGTPQMVEEAMTRGQAGLALQQQRQQALQSYLSSGQTPGDVAMGLYNQQQNQLRAAQAAALGYLGSGQTPYQAGASYLNTAENRAASAAQGGPVYSPQGPSGYYTGAGTSSFPQYGLDMSQLSNQWYNSMNQWNMQAAALGGAGGRSSGQQLGKAATGALSGAASGAAMGSAIPGIGTAVGAIGGALAGGGGGYFG